MIFLRGDAKALVVSAFGRVSANIAQRTNIINDLFKVIFNHPFMTCNAQCNNIYIFPGLGLSVLSSGATRISDAMLDTAVETLAACSPIATCKEAPLLPVLDDTQKVTCDIALAVALQAQKEGLAEECSEEELHECIKARFWSPEFCRIRIAYC